MSIVVGCCREIFEQLVLFVTLLFVSSAVSLLFLVEWFDLSALISIFLISVLSIRVKCIDLSELLESLVDVAYC